MAVQVDRRRRGAADDGDVGLVQVAANGLRSRGRADDGRRIGAGSLEAELVLRVGVAHVEHAAGRIRDHVEDDGPDVVERAGRRWRGRIGADREDVVVGQEEAHGGIPVPREAVLPVGAVVLDDEARGRSHGVREVVARKRKFAIAGWNRVESRGRAGSAIGAHRAGADGGRLVAGMEDGRIDRISVGAHRERARRVAEERDFRERRAAKRRAEAGRVEDPHVGATEPGGRHVCDRDAAVLAAVRAGDEDALAEPAAVEMGLVREDDVARLVADEQRLRDARCGRGGPIELDNAHAVGEVIDDPHLGIRPRCDRDRLHPDRDRNEVGRGRGTGRHVEDLEPVVRGVDGEEPRLTRMSGIGDRERERPDLAALELDERGGARIGGERGGQDDGEKAGVGEHDVPYHASFSAAII